MRKLLKLAAEGGVDYVALDTPVSPQGVVDYSKLLSSTSYIHATDTNDAWDDNYDGKGVGIAVIDSGVAAAPDFGGGSCASRAPRRPGRTTTWSDTARWSPRSPPARAPTAASSASPRARTSMR
ncbi:MAG: hypothetical protein ABR521_14650 [Gaiellaceae bacterium]